jgi:uncharacterized protein (DUF305 family)
MLSCLRVRICRVPRQTEVRLTAAMVLLLPLLLLSLPIANAQAQQAGRANASADPPGTSTVVQPGAPGQPSKILPAATRPPVPPVAEADIEFMQGMIVHHSQAVEMTALIPSRTQNPEVRSIGAKISSSQSDEMSFMKRWLLSRGQPTTMSAAAMEGMHMSGDDALMPGMLTSKQMQALREAQSADFDRLFLTGMIQHHNGALIMVKDLFDSPGAGQDADLFNFATDADNTQRAEMRIMQGMLEKKQ